MKRRSKRLAPDSKRRREITPSSVALHAQGRGLGWTTTCLTRAQIRCARAFPKRRGITMNHHPRGAHVAESIRARAIGLAIRGASSQAVSIPVYRQWLTLSAPAVPRVRRWRNRVPTGVMISGVGAQGKPWLAGTGAHGTVRRHRAGDPAGGRFRRGMVADQRGRLSSSNGEVIGLRVGARHLGFGYMGTSATRRDLRRAM